MISLEGVYDFHCHPGPSIQKRMFTSYEALKLSEKEKMGGVFLLDHTYNTTMVAATVNEMGFNAKAYGCLMLNEGVGGLNPSVVEIAVGFRTKQIQMPTYSSKAHLEAYGDDQKIFPYKKRSKPSYILNEKGRLIPQVQEILDLIKGTDTIIGSGHLSTEEVDVLVKRVKELKITFVANTVSTDMPGYPIDAQKSWADDNVFMEHAYMAVTDVPHVKMPVSVVVEQIRAVGAERCLIGTDAGNMRLPDNVTALKDFIKRLTEAGLTDKEVDIIGRKNPKIALGIS